MRRRRWLSAMGALIVAVGATTMGGPAPALGELRGNESPASVVSASPEKPTAFSAAPGDGIFTLTFHAPGDGGSPITGYEYSTDGGGSWRTLSNVAGDTSEQAVISSESSGGNNVPLAYNVPYNLEVRADNAVGGGAPSDTVAATIGPKSPDAPGPVTVDVGNGIITLGFAAPRDYGSTITAWEYTTDNGVHWQPLSVSGTSQLTGRVTSQSTGDGTAPLQPGQVYQLRVHAENSVGVGPDSQTLSVSLPTAGAPGAPPGAPSNLGVVARQQGGFTLTFTAVPDNGSPITGWEYTTDNGADWQALTGVTGDMQLSATLLNQSTGDGTALLAGGTTYRIRVHARNGIGVGPDSPTVAASLPSPGAPGAPGGVSVTPSSGVFGVDFTAPAPGDGSIIGYQYSTDDGNSWRDTATSGNGPLHADLKVESGTGYPVYPGNHYRIRVRAANTQGPGLPSAAVETSLPPAAPGSPYNLSVMAREQGGFTLTFGMVPDNGSPLTGWEYTTDNGAHWQTLTGVTGLMQLTTTIADQSTGDGSAPLAGGMTYQIRVRARNAIGPGPDSQTVEGSLPNPGSPAAPGDVVVSPAGNDFGVNFTVPAPGDSPILEYQYSTDDGTSWRYTPVAGNGPLQADLTVESGTGYQFYPGNHYRIRLRAVNTQGPGLPSAAAEVNLPPAAPGSPFGLSAVPQASGGFALAFGFPPDNGSEITGWEYATDDDAHWRPLVVVSGDQQQLTAVIVNQSIGDGTTPIAAGTQYEIRVRARNAIGPGPDAATVVSLPNAGTPAAPGGVSAAPDGVGFGVDFTAPDPGDSAIIKYQYSTDDGNSWADTPTTTGGGSLHTDVKAASGKGLSLYPGNQYRIRIRAVNTQGAGWPSAATDAALPATAPGAPFDVQVEPGDQAVTMTWGASDNGSQISGYDYSTDGGTNWQPLAPITNDDNKTASSTILTASTGDGTARLQNGQSYQLRLRATNKIGTGPGSEPVTVALPMPGSPGRPTELAGSSSGDTIGIDFTAPDQGDSAISKYQYSTDDGDTWADVTAGGDTSILHVDVSATSGNGLALGRDDQYRIRLRAVNTQGPGLPSARTEVGLPPTEPGEPFNIMVVPGSRQATVTLSADSNGSEITKLEYSTDDGITWQELTDITPVDESSARVTITTVSSGGGVDRLVDGVTYQLRLRVSNDLGLGAPSDAVSFTPVNRVPAAPTGLTSTASDQKITVNFKVPDDGGSAITLVRYSTDGGKTWAAANPMGTGPFTIVITAQSTGDGTAPLVNGEAYAVRLLLTNAAGDGAASEAVTVTPVTVPEAAATLTVTPADGAGKLAFALPGNGGSAITGWEYSTDGGDTWATLSDPSGDPTLTTAISIGSGPGRPKLVNDTAYQVMVRALNVMGAGAPSPAAALTPLAPPSAPTGVSVAARTSAVSVSWTAPAAGGAPVTGYTAIASPGPATCETTTATTCVLGAELERPYTITVVAHSGSGDSPASSASASVTASAPVIPTAPPVTNAVLATPNDSDNITPPGSTLTIRGTGYAPNSEVALVVYSAPMSLGTVLTDAHGEFSVDVVVPPTLAGDHSIAAMGADPQGNVRAMRLDVTVAADTPTSAPTTSAPAPTTSSPSTPTTPSPTTPSSTPSAPTPLAPSAPTGVSVTARTSAISVSWTAPAAGGAPVTGYTATASPGPANCETTTATSCVLGAELDRPYTITVVAHSAGGDSPPSAASASVTAADPVIPVTAPDTNAVLVTPGDSGDITAPGSTLTIRGTGYAPNSEVALVVYSSPVSLGTVVTDARGGFSADVVIPPTLAGDHSIVALGADPQGNPRAMRLDITIAADTPGPTPTGPAPTPVSPIPPDLPKTGPTTAPTALLGLLILLFGAGLVGAVRLGQRRARRRVCK